MENKMEKLVLFFLSTALIILNSLPAFSQTNQSLESFGTVSGTVIDAITNDHLVGVNIYFQNTTIGSASDTKGKFLITNIPSGLHTIVASMIGYKPEKKLIMIRENNVAEINIGLIVKQVEEANGKIDSLMKTYDFPQVNVIGERPSLLSTIPGSANVVQNKELKNAKPISGNEIFKNVTGINVVSEEGAGLRANIGIRGLDPDRSRNVLMMEDGVPIALAPYGEPEMYYTPAIDRMNSIEILKGSGSILYGPQTIGGVINYITYDPPLNSRLSLNIKGGSNGYVNAQTNYGTTIDNVGFQINYLYKQADKLGITRFDLNDLTAKIKFQAGKKSRIGIKLAFYDENSNSTYVGLTQSMYSNGEYFTIIAPNDELNIRRYSASLTHDYFFSDKSFLRTTVYGYTTTRNWLRQDFSRNPIPNGTGIVFGDTTISGGAIYMKNSTGNRNRQFDVAGIEPRIQVNYSIGGIENEMEGGIRFHFERAFEQRINGDKADAKSGELRNDEIRTGYATSVFAQNRIYLTENFILSSGLRLENFNYERDIFRINSVDTSITNNSYVFAVVPGVGINYNFSRTISIFAGVHKGFAPPRIKDAISSGGVALELDAESSWNYELGIRSNTASFLYFEVTGFMLDFSNKIIPVSESSGGTGTGLVNGGKTYHIGVESAVRFDLHRVLNSEYLISLSLNSTYVNSKYNADRFIAANGESINVQNKKLPYTPEWTFSALLDATAPFGLGLHFAATYVSTQFTDELNTIEASPSGETGEMPAFFVFDITGSYVLPSINSSVFISIKNLLDERYIASRRPQGIKVGVPRFITGGVELTL
jgi:Fe(3+) dicitrate transport protein